jgi:hypothetical protein
VVRHAKASWLLILLAVYAAGLTHGMSRPWTGMHDWNGAFFSQLARNLLRYPMAVHHGMGIVAVGEAVPPPEERSIYATHPPGLIWLVALSFRLLGEAEWTARLVAVLASLGSLALLVRIVGRGWGRATALLCGLVYSVLPMAVYFGRMVDHEAVGLFCMLGATSAWQALTAVDCLGRRRRVAEAAWIAAIWGAVWIDWSGVLFAALFCVHACVQVARKRIPRSLAVMVIVAAAVGCAAMLVHLVCGGLQGRWSDLLAIFTSRATESDGAAIRKDLSAPGGPWEYAVEGITWPVMLLAVVGVLLTVTARSAQCGEAAPRERVCRDCTDALWVLPATGVIWLCVFWRQYERHNYWLFYLGPPAALLATQALLEFRERLTLYGARRANGAMYAILAMIMAVAFRGTDGYFARTSYPIEVIAAWAEINHRTRPDDRVLLYGNPVLEEQRGGYRFRNVVPPQLAYYMDRAFDVEPDLSGAIAKASMHAAYVVPMKVVMEQSSRAADLEARYAARAIGPFVVFDLRSQRP